MSTATKNLTAIQYVNTKQNLHAHFEIWQMSGNGLLGIGFVTPESSTFYDTN